MSYPSSPSIWVIRVCEPGDEPGITDLFQTVYGRPAPQGYWKWKLHSLPATAENEWVAECDGRIVGHYAVNPVRFKLRDRQVLIPHGCDAMTHPEYRGQGILSALGQRANEIWARAGSPFQIGFHYGGWGSVRESLGWQPVVRLVWMKRWIKPFSSLASQIRLPGAPIWKDADAVFHRFLERREDRRHENSDTSRVCVATVTQADDRFDHLWNELSAAYDILAVRDRPWVQWRCLDRPGAEQRLFLAMRAGEPLGYIALRMTQTDLAVRAAILDCFVAPGDAVTAHALLRHAVTVAAERGARSIAALVAPESCLADRLRMGGFHAGRHGYDFSVISYSSLAPSSINTGWFLTGAEGDVL